MPNNSHQAAAYEIPNGCRVEAGWRVRRNLLMERDGSHFLSLTRAGTDDSGWGHLLCFMPRRSSHLLDHLRWTVSKCVHIALLGRVVGRVVATGPGRAAFSRQVSTPRDPALDIVTFHYFHLLYQSYYLVELKRYIMIAGQSFSHSESLITP